jgi:hypothetical protein
MSAPTYDAAGKTEAGTEEDVPERRVISEKAIAEMDQLHREVVATKPPKPWSPIALRRRHRDARVAESDFLRALGFEDWETFDAYVKPEPEPEPEVDVDLVRAEAEELLSRAERRGPEEPPVDLIDIAELVRVVLHQLGDTRADLRTLQASSARVDEVLERALLEIVALRLELIAMASRAK